MTIHDSDCEQCKKKDKHIKKLETAVKGKLAYTLDLQRKYDALVDGLQNCQRYGWTRKGLKEYPNGNLLYVADVRALLEDTDE